MLVSTKEKPATRYAERSSSIAKANSAITPCENQSCRASGLSLVTAAIVHWNTVYLDRAVQHLREQGRQIADELVAHVAPLGWEHIALTGDYVWEQTTPSRASGPFAMSPVRSNASLLSVQFLTDRDVAP